MEKLTHVQYCAQEFKENARAKRRQAEILKAEADVLDRCADRVIGAEQMDERASQSAR